jgi:succinylglutamate desuccinylase
LERVFAELERRAPRMHGAFVGLTGNVRAYDEGVRYVAKDLNRQWTSRKVAALDARGPDARTDAPALDAEDREQRELVGGLREVFAAAGGPVSVLDLHTASSVSAPFLIFGDTLRNRNFATRIPSPIVLGVEEMISGTIMEWVTSQGHASIAFEAGQHDDPASIDRHEAAIWIALVATGVLAREDTPAYARSLERLSAAAAGIPRVMEVVGKHAITATDQFAMKPGFRNFARVAKGDVLATDRNGEIHSPGELMLLFPLYQKLGEDGFFLARPVNPIWLAVSAAARKIGLGELAPWLPGVRRHPERRDTLVVNRRIARFGVREIFHLLGYRIEASRGEKMIVRRRRD